MQAFHFLNGKNEKHNSYSCSSICIKIDGHSLQTKFHIQKRLFDNNYELRESSQLQPFIKSGDWMWWSSKSNMNTKLIGLMHITYYQLRCLAAMFILPLLPPIQADGGLLFSFYLRCLIVSPNVENTAVVNI